MPNLSHSSFDISQFIPAGLEDTIVIRTTEEDGTLCQHPLLLAACEEGIYGTHYAYDGGCVDQSLFTYLSGRPSAAFFNANPDLFIGALLVCRSREWTAFIKTLDRPKLSMTRWTMVPKTSFSLPQCKPLGSGYVLAPFDERAFAVHPFNHGANYSWESFQREGSGYVVWQGNTIVASASSFVSHHGHLELDVSTLPEHRGHGLATACVSSMLEDCQTRGFTVHWDAQNLTSKRLAEKFGYSVEQEYAVTKML